MTEEKAIYATTEDLMCNTDFTKPWTSYELGRIAKYATVAVAFDDISPEKACALARLIEAGAAANLAGIAVRRFVDAQKKKGVLPARLPARPAPLTATVPFHEATSTLKLRAMARAATSKRVWGRPANVPVQIMLTDDFLLALRPARSGTYYEVYDAVMMRDGKLSVRVSAGTKANYSLFGDRAKHPTMTFVLRFINSKGRKAQFALGRYPELGIDAARKAASDLLIPSSLSYKG